MTWFISFFILLNVKQNLYRTPSSEKLDVSPHYIFMIATVKKWITVIHEDKRVIKIKYLGLIYDSKINWKHHCNKHLTSLVSAFYNIFKMLRLILDANILKTVYFSLVNYNILYGITIWSGTFLKTIYLKKALSRAH